MSVTVTLRQEKLTLSDKFVSISWITAASPVGYYPLFVVSENLGDPTDERFEGVATLNDLVTYEENPLIRIECAPPVGAIAGDRLEITNAPDYWFDSFLTVAKFTVTLVDFGDDYMTIETAVPFPTALADVSWTLRDATETTVRGSGTGARCVREVVTGLRTYLRRHLTKTFTEIKAAVDHVDAVSAFLNSLVDAANADASPFTPPPYTEVIS